MAKTLLEWTNEVEEWTKRKGWWDDGRTFGDMIALAHSELSEALEEFRKHGIKYGSKDVYYGGVADDSKPGGVAIEIADVFIRLFHMAAHYGWDLDELCQIKMAYNERRAYRHGNLAL